MTYEQELKKAILIGGKSITQQQFLKLFYQMLELFDMQGDYFNNNSLWIHGKPTIIISVRGSLFCVQIASGTYRLLGIPVSSTIEELEEATIACLNLGLNLRIGEGDLSRVTELFKPLEKNDNYNYYFGELGDYFNTCSKQSRKVKNKLEKLYSYEVLKYEDMTVELFARIEEINSIWLDQFKSNSSKSKLTLSYIQMVQKYKLNWDNLRFIIYTDRETNIVMAYDYIEAWCQGNKIVGCAAAGKAIIPKYSTFKWVTINIVKLLKSELNADYCMLGGSNMYNLDGTVSDPKAGNVGLKVAKTSIPCKQTFTYVYKFNPSKFKSIDVEDKTSQLF